MKRINQAKELLNKQIENANNEIKEAKKSFEYEKQALINLKLKINTLYKEYKKLSAKEKAEHCFKSLLNDTNFWFNDKKGQGLLVWELNEDSLSYELMLKGDCFWYKKAMIDLSFDVTSGLMRNNIGSYFAFDFEEKDLSKSRKRYSEKEKEEFESHFNKLKSEFLLEDVVSLDAKLRIVDWMCTGFVVAVLTKKDCTIYPSKDGFCDVKLMFRKQDFFAFMRRYFGDYDFKKSIIVMQNAPLLQHKGSDKDFTTVHMNGKWENRSVSFKDFFINDEKVNLHNLLSKNFVSGNYPFKLRLEKGVFELLSSREYL